MKIFDYVLRCDWHLLNKLLSEFMYEENRLKFGIVTFIDLIFSIPISPWRFSDFSQSLSLNQTENTTSRPEHFMNGHCFPFKCIFKIRKEPT